MHFCWQGCVCKLMCVCVWGGEIGLKIPTGCIYSTQCRTVFDRKIYEWNTCGPRQTSPPPKHTHTKAGRPGRSWPCQLFVSQNQMGGDFLRTKGENRKWQNKRVLFSLSLLSFICPSTEEEWSATVFLSSWLTQLFSQRSSLSHIYIHTHTHTLILLHHYCLDHTCWLLYDHPYGCYPSGCHSHVDTPSNHAGIPDLERSGSVFELYNSKNDAE